MNDEFAPAGPGVPDRAQTMFPQAYHSEESD